MVVIWKQDPSLNLPKSLTPPLSWLSSGTALMKSIFSVSVACVIAF
jgi:hypothetical protein